jgi:hypothetical protein
MFRAGIDQSVWSLTADWTIGIRFQAWERIVLFAATFNDAPVFVIFPGIKAALSPSVV